MALDQAPSIHDFCGYQSAQLEDGKPTVTFAGRNGNTFTTSADDVVEIYKNLPEFQRSRVKPAPKSARLILENGLVSAWKATGHDMLQGPKGEWAATLAEITQKGFRTPPAGFRPARPLGPLGILTPGSDL